MSRLPSRRIGTTAALAGLVAATLASTGGAAGRPVLRLADDRPLAVSGVGFAAGERVSVRVLVAGRAPYGATFTASGSGSFMARFPRRALSVCPRYVITAVGNEGSRATLRERIPPPCGMHE